ncbi:MAG: sulfatase-like hydrolase/transferase, partial [Verrucomicrobiales bacterium]|nr:sulfatase-like hydrolase/transferase [Verrucomicrobiales bacterium]
PLICGAILLTVFTLTRLALLIGYHPPKAAPVGDYVALFAIGLQQDVVATLVWVTPLALWSLLRRGGWSLLRAVLLFAVLLVAWMVQTFLFVSEFFFFDEFQSRFNTVAIDYLIYPHEVVTNLEESYPLGLILAGVAAGGLLLTWLCWRWARPGPAVALPGMRRLAGAGLWLLVVLAAVGSLALTGARASHERVLNEVAANGLVSGARAAWTRNLEYAAFYRSLPREEAWGRVRRLVGAPDSTFVSDQPEDLRRRVAGDASRPKLNVCLLLEESLGSEFWGTLGRVDRQGKPHSFTRRLDEVANEKGMLFTHLYADGNRTIRGFEGVFSSFPSLPGDSIVARDRTENVETIAKVLGRDGYQTTFIYAGRSMFDGMGPFATNNGWQRFIEEGDFPEPTFTTAWGVCNEDLYDRAITEMRALHETGQPFLMTTLSVSNHRPYTYPEGRIKEDPNEKRRTNAVKYTDYALGQFFKKAEREPFWKDTIFVVIADHGARVYGSEDIPIRSYQIPLLIVGPAVVPQPSRVEALGCQLDVAPTILGLIGRPYETLFFGHDLLNPANAPFARVLMHHNREVAIYARQRLVVLGLNQSEMFYQGDPNVGDLQPMEQPDDIARELGDDLAAMLQVADELYTQRRFTLTPAVEPAAP